MRVTVEICKPEVDGPSSAHLILRDPETSLPVAEIAIRGAGYVVLSETERARICVELLRLLDVGSHGDETEESPIIEVPDREGGYHGEPPLWVTTAAEQAAKRGTPSRVVKVGGKKVKVVESLEDIQYPEGCEFLPLTPEEIAAGQTIGIVKVPSRKGEDAEGKRFRRACKRARAQQFAFLESQRNPDAVEDGDEDGEESEE